MLFHSATFAVFLLTALTLFWALSPSRRLRTLLLLAASYGFYGTWHLHYLGLIVFSTLLDYVCGLAIAGAPTAGRRKLYLLLSLAGNLGVLGFFKYYDFFIESAVDLAALLGLDISARTLGLVVPVGISFYTFQTLSYTIDIYRGVLRPTRNLIDFALFVSFFPQLVAGPIVRAIEFLPQLELSPRFDRARLHDGLYRIATGLMKKVFIADLLARYLVTPVYEAPGTYGPLIHLLAAYGFCFQIYGDFSGYSDIAIGAARLFGFDLPENFRGPFKARSVRDFWRRWHITLSFWVRDYVYFPLGGSRAGRLRVSFNLILTMVLIGLWHGASLLWIVYGLLNGLAMSIERLVSGASSDAPRPSALGLALRRLATFQFVAATLVLVRAPDQETVVAMLTDFGDVHSVSWKGLAVLAGAILVHYLPEGALAGIESAVKRVPTVAAGVILGLLCGLLALAVVGETPYIYFRF